MNVVQTLIQVAMIFIRLTFNFSRFGFLISVDFFLLKGSQIVSTIVQHKCKLLFNMMIDNVNFKLR